MPWTLIDSTMENDALLELYGKDGIFMIRVNGFELMNGFCHDSEDALGRLAAECAPAREPRVLVGGLGLGYTAVALADALGASGTITVAELSTAVIGWFHQYVELTVLPKARGDFRIVRADVASLLATGDLFDVVVLDVDNGPEPVVTAGNATLYSPAGLDALYACLSADGTALLWSGFESAAFETRAKQAGFTVESRRFERSRADLFHLIYVLTKKTSRLSKIIKN